MEKHTLNSINKQEKIALITGGARRIGAVIAEALHSQGYTVVIHYLHSKHEAQQLANQFNAKRQNSSFIVHADLSNVDSIQNMVKPIAEREVGLSVLINNASQFTTDQLLTHYQDWQNLFAVNVLAPYQLSLQSYPMLKINNGVIINITDIHAQKPLKNYALYCQSKAALHMQTLALARAFSPDVRVNAVAPGAILWPENQNEITGQVQDEIIAKTPLKKHGNPHYIAQAVLALINNAFITGQTLTVDGGRSIV